jgi:hypothetical protein
MVACLVKLFKLDHSGKGEEDSPICHHGLVDGAVLPYIRL